MSSKGDKAKAEAPGHNNKQVFLCHLPQDWEKYYFIFVPRPRCDGHD